jgi:chromosome segregation ATPase
MNIRSNKRLLGLMLVPFALFSACVGLTPEEQAEYDALQSEVQRIQVEEIGPRQMKLHEIGDGKLAVNVTELQEKVNQIRNEKLGPLEHRLSGLQSGGEVLAAPGTKIELEELNRSLEELKMLYAGLQSQINETRGQMESAKKIAGQQIEEEITLLEIELKAQKTTLENLFNDTDIAAIEINASLAEYREMLETLEADSADADEIRAQIAELESEWETLHDNESGLKTIIEARIEATEAAIHELREEIESRHHALAEQFGDLIHELEVTLHDVSEEKESVVRKIHELELSAPEELEQAIEELEVLIEEIVSTELRPLIERINAAVAGGDPNAALREELRAELEEWLAEIASKRARMNELSSKSFQSMLSGLDLGGLGTLVN